MPRNHESDRHVSTCRCVWCASDPDKNRAMTRNHESAITVDPLIVECPVCLAGPGDRCVRMSDGTTPCPPHDNRWNKARCFLAHPSQVAR